MTDLQPALTGLRKARKRGLNRFAGLRRCLVTARRMYLVHVYGMNIDATAEVSLRAKLDRTFPIGVHVGAHSYVALEAMMLCHDRTRGLYLHTFVGRDCFIGARSILMPGISVGDGSIVAAGAVVTRDVPSGVVVAGNPARIIREDIQVGSYGRFTSADAREDRLVVEGLA